MEGRKFTPKDVLELTRPTDGFLCKLSANVYGIKFLNFRIVDYSTKAKIFEVGKSHPPKFKHRVGLDKPASEDAVRTICYDFSEDVIRLPTIMTSLEFSVGQKEVHNFRMIERHYFRNELVKSFDFKFGFCIPGSVNTWDAVYSVPPLDEDIINAMIDNPYATESDSFYFAGDELIMHNKAEYKYIREDAAQAKSYFDHDKVHAKHSEYDSESKERKLESKEMKWSKEDDYSDED